MLKISKLTDYSFLILSVLAKTPRNAKNSTQISEELGLQHPTTAKLLKLLSANNIISSARGCNGGYLLSKTSDEISAYDVINSIEGAIALTECAQPEDNFDALKDPCNLKTSCNAKRSCNLIESCRLKDSWILVNTYFVNVMKQITLSDLMGNVSEKLNILKSINSNEQ
ncbi:MAG: hypothetical protein HOI53_06965 [Francisellaceae bacterium]|jgi:Rrf2 family protein|nr:hypothetical protein [Francisellaceae bacterium]MBT6207752.1 hypothetical protein [Francisellaceae bacterium]MBT6538060.1 hypothetical protein [Francisellaceae bacterium]